MKRRLSPVVTGTLILTLTGLLSRLLGFAYRIYLSRTIGAEELGIYQMISPVSGICFGLCCGPIQTAISRFCARESAARRNAGARRVLTSGLFLSELLAFPAGIILYRTAGFCAEVLLGEPRTELLLRFLALSLPISAAHASVNGYYYGRRLTAVPAAGQLIEQLVRVGFVVWLTGLLSRRQIVPDASVAAAGLAAGEIAAFTVTHFACRAGIFREKLREIRLPSPKDISPSLPRIMKDILLLAAPLMANRLTLGIFQSAEAACIPGRLQSFGYSAEEALTLYGILTGMALPFVFFPSALTNSAAVMLLPSVAQAQSAGDQERIRATAGTAVNFSLLLGIFAAGIFASCGGEMGRIFFASSQAGEYISILGWLCPFLYLSTTASSILGGMGLTRLTFLIHLSGVLVRLGFILFLVPRYGMKACLLGMLAGELADSAACLTALIRTCRMPFPVFRRLLIPMGAIFAACCISGRILPLTTENSSRTALLFLAVRCCLTLLIYMALLIPVSKSET